MGEIGYTWRKGKKWRSTKVEIKPEAGNGGSLLQTLFKLPSSNLVSTGFLLLFCS